MSARVGAAWAIAVVGLVLLPLGGLLSAWLQPADAFGAARPDAGAIRAALPLLGTTLGLALCTSAIAVPLGTWLAWVEQRAAYPGAKWLGALGLMPLAVPSYIMASTLRETLGPAGALGAPLGLPAFIGFGPSVLALSLVTLPYVQLLVGAGLRRMSAAEEEAARTLGASARRVFFRIALPRLRPTLALSALVVQLYVVADFGAVAVLDCRVLTWRMYQAVDQQQLASAALLGAATLVAIAPLLIASRWLHGAVPRLTQVANPRPPARRELRGAARVATYVAHAFAIGLGVLLPALVLVGWVIEGVRYDESFASLSQPLLDTVLAAGGGAALTLLLALGPAWVAARTRRAGLEATLEHGTYVTSALPGVLLAFGLILAALAGSRATGDGGAMYQGLLGGGALLALGYAMRFVAEGYAGLKVAALSVDRRWEEAARALAAPRRRWWARVVAPALAPGAVASFVLLFLAVLKELPITLLLGGAMGLRPLSFRVYDRYQDAFLHDAGLAGLALLGIALLAVWATLGYRRHV